MKYVSLLSINAAATAVTFRTVKHLTVVRIMLLWQCVGAAIEEVDEVQLERIEVVQKDYTNLQYK